MYKLLCLVLLVSMMLVITGCNNAVPLPSPPSVEETPDQRNPLTGYLDGIAQSPLMWVVDNHPQARPQDGLNKAILIYEVPVEGGFTRFLLLTTETSTGLIGPIRSARGYFALIAAEYGSILVHHGSSPTYSGAILALGLRHIDLLDPLSQPVWRDAGREAPHNLYSDISKGSEYADPLLTMPYTGRKWAFSDSIASRKVSVISLGYPGGYKVEYQLDEGGSYERINSSFADFSVENIIVQQTMVRDGAEVSVELLSSGTAYLFSGGQVSSGLWSKSSASGPTIFSNADGTEWHLRPGRTIIHIVPTLTTVQYR